MRRLRWYRRVWSRVGQSSVGEDAALSHRSARRVSLADQWQASGGARRASTVASPKVGGRRWCRAVAPRSGAALIKCGLIRQQGTVKTQFAAPNVQRILYHTVRSSSR